MKTTFVCKILRGDIVTVGFSPEDLNSFSRRWGMSRASQFLAAANFAGKINLAHCAITGNGEIVVTDIDGDSSPKAKAELVIVQEYQPGVGAKRYPAFKIDFTSFDDLKILKTIETSGGSGWERHSLVIAPLGWAEQVGGSFINQRDIGDQTISLDDIAPPKESNFVSAFAVALRKEVK